LTEPLRRIYRWLLKLYPRSFRAEFGSEMETVFAGILSDAARQGRMAAIRAFGREIIAIPIAALGEYLKGQGIRMPQDGTSIVPVSWPKVLLGILPGLLFVLWIFGFGSDYLGGVEHSFERGYNYVIIISSICVIIGVVWERQIAAWSLPTIGALVLLIMLEESMLRFLFPILLLIVSIGLTLLNRAKTWPIWVILAAWSIPAIGVFVTLATPEQTMLSFLLFPILLLIVLIGLTVLNRAKTRPIWVILASMILLAIGGTLLRFSLSGELQGALKGTIPPDEMFLGISGSITWLELILFPMIVGLPFAPRYRSTALLVTLGTFAAWLTFCIAPDDPTTRLVEIAAFALGLLLMVGSPLMVFRAGSLNGRLVSVIIPLFIGMFGLLVLTFLYEMVGFSRPLLSIAAPMQVLLAFGLAFILYEQVGRLRIRVV
jgi:hypothetical protein